MNYDERENKEFEGNKPEIEDMLEGIRKSRTDEFFCNKQLL